MKKIKKIGISQTSKVIAIIVFCVTSIFMLVFLLFSFFQGLMRSVEYGFGFPFRGSFFFLLLVPFGYAIVAFIATAVSCKIYNATVHWTGGIELELDTTDDFIE